MPLSFPVRAVVLARVVRPDILADTLAKSVLEVTIEPTLIVFILHGSVALQSAVFIPSTRKLALSNLHVAFAHQLALEMVIVCGSVTVFHCEKGTLLEIRLPCSFDFLDFAVTWGESHHTFSVQFVVLHASLVDDLAGPGDLKFPFHGLVSEGTLVGGPTLRVDALSPLVAFEGALKGALATSLLQVSDLALAHLASFKDALEDGLVACKLQFSLPFSLVHRIDLSIVSRTVAVDNVADG